MGVSHSFWGDDGSRRRMQEDQKGTQDHRTEIIVIHFKVSLKD